MSIDISNITCRNYEAVAIGTSAGGMRALERLFSQMNNNCSLAFVVVQHVSPGSDDYYIQYLNEKSNLTIKQADEKESIQKGHVYVAPPDYHLLVEEDKTLSLSIDRKINYSRPSIDLMFETAAFAYESSLIGIVLTGANKDGSMGLKKIKGSGGITIVQDPKTAEVSMMPQAAMNTVDVDYILSIDEIASLLRR